jgi:hypothetical protein
MHKGFRVAVVEVKPSHFHYHKEWSAMLCKTGTRIVAACGFMVALAISFAANARDLIPAADADLRELMVGQNPPPPPPGPCREDSKDTVADNQCGPTPEVPCKQALVDATYTLGVQGGLPFIMATGSVSLTFKDIPAGCADKDPNGTPNGVTQEYCQVCPPALKFIDGGNPKMTALYRQSCPNYKYGVCMEGPGKKIYVLPADTAGLLGLDKTKQWTITMDVTVCKGDPNKANTAPCPGTPGGQTWYEIGGPLCKP